MPYILLYVKRIMPFIDFSFSLYYTILTKKKKEGKSMKYYAITCVRGHQGARNNYALITFYVEAKDIIAAAKVAQRMGGIKHTRMPVSCRQITREEYEFRRKENAYKRAMAK